MKLTCAHSECCNIFEPNTHNQKYCSPECCKLATNAKIMERYYERKANRAGRSRKCFQCGAVLSRYNDSKTCNSCAVESKRSQGRDVLAALLAMKGKTHGL